MTNPSVLDSLVDEAPADAKPIEPVLSAAHGGPELPAYAKAVGFTGAAGTVCLLPSADGGIERILAGLGDGSDRWAMAALPGQVPAGVYRLAVQQETAAATEMAVAWALGTYSFDRYRSGRTDGQPRARLVWPESADRPAAVRLLRAVQTVRDMINTPASDMGPAEVEAVAREIATRHGAGIEVIVGDALIERNYPAVHAVGRASSRAPRLIDITWGSADHPKVTLVGKGVCFDTGGLDIKPASSMRLMKKDMGGAAHALALAGMVMEAGLPVRLRVLVPAVENAVSGDSFRPGDILATRKGLTVEVSNTDAEGRLILCDALAEADSESPALLFDFATLTGAARVALGPELPAMFSNDDRLADALLQSSRKQDDPLWRLPLWPGYGAMVESKVADLDNAPEGGMAGAVTAALFLQHFVSPTTPWVHLDVYGWNPKPRPGRPLGGFEQGLKAVFGLLHDRFG